MGVHSSLRKRVILLLSIRIVVCLEAGISESMHAGLLVATILDHKATFLPWAWRGYLELNSVLRRVQSLSNHSPLRIQNVKIIFGPVGLEVKGDKQYAPYFSFGDGCPKLCS